MRMTGEDPVLFNDRVVMPSGAIVEVFGRHSDSITTVGGVKYRLHYGFPGDEHPVVRYDNRHG